MGILWNLCKRLTFIFVHTFENQSQSPFCLALSNNSINRKSTSQPPFWYCGRKSNRYSILYDHHASLFGKQKHMTQERTIIGDTWAQSSPQQPGTSTSAKTAIMKKLDVEDQSRTRILASRVPPKYPKDQSNVVGSECLLLVFICLTAPNKGSTILVLL